MKKMIMVLSLLIIQNVMATEVCKIRIETNSEKCTAISECTNESLNLTKSIKYTDHTYWQRVANIPNKTKACDLAEIGIIKELHETGFERESGDIFIKK
jgi:hypothetical protein